MSILPLAVHGRLGSPSDPLPDVYIVTWRRHQVGRLWTLCIYVTQDSVISMSPSLLFTMPIILLSSTVHHISDVWPGHYLATVTSCIYLIRMSYGSLWLIWGSKTFSNIQDLLGCRLGHSSTSISNNKASTLHTWSWSASPTLYGMCMHLCVGVCRPTYEIRKNLDVSQCQLE